MTHVTSSVVVAKALGLQPAGIESDREGNCAYCGLSIKKGDLIVPFFANPSFMDDHSMANKGSDMTCGHCAVLMSNEGLRASGYGIFSTDGARPFRKWADVTAGLTNPPQGPFVVCYATANNQHMAWRAPVNFSRELFYIRVGLRDLKIRRPKLLAAVKTAERMGQQIGRKPTDKSLAHPFAGLSPDLKDVSAGMFMNKVWELCSQEDIQEMMSLTTGEIWAMRFLLSPGAGLAPPAR